MPALSDAQLGVAAGLSVSLLWTGTSLFFTAAGRRIGATRVNAFRIVIAIILLAITHHALTGVWMPRATAGQFAFLAGSGLVGLTIGDQALFAAFVQIGPRLSMLMMTTAPLLAALFGFLALGERITPVAWLGMAATIGGVAWVVSERPRTQLPVVGASRSRGIVLAIIATICQAGGYLLSKQGIGHGWLPKEQHIAPQTATLLRLFFAGVGMVPVLLWYWQRERRRQAAGIPSPYRGPLWAGLAFATCGALVGPYLGIWMSLVAADKLPLGVAQTLLSLPPVFVLPFSRLVHKEHIGPRAVLGAFVAVAGVAILAVWGKA